MVKTRSGKGVDSGSELEQPSQEGFVQRVKEAEGEGGYASESEKEPEPKKQKTEAEGKVVGDEEEGGEGEAPGEQGEGGGPAPETPAAKQASQQRGAANTQGEKEAAAVEVMGADQEAEAEEGGSQGAKEGEAAGQPAEGGQGGPSSQPPEIERGRIYFFYRPKVAVAEAEGLGDVQRFFMVLDPTAAPAVYQPMGPEGGEGGEGGAAGRPTKARLSVIGKKRLPAVERRERLFGFIEASAERVQELLEGLGPRSYETKTRGRRELAGARALGEGIYAILPHGDHTHLAYKLELPAEAGDVQQEFNIANEGSCIFTVKNPSNVAPQGLADKAEYSEEKRAEFKQYSWIPVRDPQLLDYERCEFLLVGALDDLRAELGGGGKGAVEAARGDAGSAECAESDEECLLQKMREEIRAEEYGIETEPAVTGEWK